MTLNSFAGLDRDQPIRSTVEPRWAIHTRLLWNRRRILMRLTGISFLASLAIAFAIPKEYKSTTSIMPPDQPNRSALMLAALAEHTGSSGALGSLFSGLLGQHSSSSLFIDLLRSGTVSGHLIDRFDLRHVYHKRYRIDTAKRLARLTKVTEDKKSGVITITVEDTNRVRARDLAQGYLDELNLLVTCTNASAAHRERIFIERRLQSVEADLESAELKLSQFSSSSNAIDIKEQTHAMVDAGARVQTELVTEEAGLQSLRRIYGDDNVKVRESEASIATLRAQLARMAGSPAPLEVDDPSGAGDNSGVGAQQAALYPPLRQLPRLAVPYADLLRRVRVQEEVFQLLTQQYELARIEEAKDTPVVSVIDPPGIAEKKSFPPRLLLTLLLTFLSFATASALILVRYYWSSLPQDDPCKSLAHEVTPVLRRRIRPIFAWRRGTA